MKTFVVRFQFSTQDHSTSEKGWKQKFVRLLATITAWGFTVDSIDVIENH